MFVNDEKPIPYINFVFLLVFFVFLVLGVERHKMGVKRLIHPSFLIEVGYELLTEEITGG